MATCGYLCPKCEGSGYLENGKACDWCGTVVKDEILENNSPTKPTEEELAEWIKQVHEGPCCSDRKEETPQDLTTTK